MNRPHFTARSYDERRNPQSPVIPMLAERASDAFVRRYLAVLMRYTGVGIIGTCAHYVLLLALVEQL